MMKRMLPLLALVIVVSFVAASDAQASCLRCSFGQLRCVEVSYQGFWYCEFIGNQCFAEDPCLGFAPPDENQPLAADYQVAAVERLDEPSAPQNETLTASLDNRKD